MIDYTVVIITSNAQYEGARNIYVIMVTDRLIV